MTQHLISTCEIINKQGAKKNKNTRKKKKDGGDDKKEEKLEEERMKGIFFFIDTHTRRGPVDKDQQERKKKERMDEGVYSLECLFKKEATTLLLLLLFPRRQKPVSKYPHTTHKRIVPPQSLIDKHHFPSVIIQFGMRRKRKFSHIQVVRQETNQHLNFLLLFFAACVVIT